MSQMMSGIRLLARATTLALSLAATSISLAAQDSSAVVTYTEEQAVRGDKVFTSVCLSCHTRRDVSGPDFRLKWNGQTAFDLFDLVQTTMPDSAPGSLSRDEYADVTAYMMKLNGVRAGTTPLPLDSMMRRIKLDIPASAPPTTGAFSLLHDPRLPMSRPLSFRSHPAVKRAATTALAAIAFMTPVAAQAQSRQPIVPKGMSASATLTPGIRIGDVVYSSGQLGMSRTAPDTTVGGQTKIALDNIKQVFEAAGTTMAQAAKCTVFLIDVKDFGGMNAAYREYFPTTPPARSTVVVAALVVAGAKVEIECVAAMPGK